jgi:feruloyl esterase
MRTEKPFFDCGGKLLMRHGWPGRQAPATVGDYSRVRTTAGATAFDGSIRRLPVPGTGDGGSGEGTEVFDRVAQLSARLKRGARPPRIESMRMKHVVSTPLPLCPYETVARWDGRGDTTLAASFAWSAAGGAGKS